MESHESQIVCFLEKPQKVLSDSAVSSRRKRREVRLLRKLSGAPASVRGLNSVQQGMLAKRSALRPLHGSNAAYWLDDSIVATENGIVPKNREAGRSCKVAANGLFRSRSFPPKGWKSSKHILQVNSFGRTPSKVVLNDADSGVTEECKILCTLSVGRKGGNELSMQLSKIADFSLKFSDVSPRKNLENGRGSSLQDVENGGLTINPTDMEEKNVLGATKLPGDANQTATEAVNDGGVMGNPVFSRKEEGRFANLCQKTTVKSKNNEGNLNSPPSGKVLLCGRRREMEDSAVIGPSFVQLGKSDTPTGSQNDSSSSLHFYGVYDGHGGSQASTFCAERFHHALAEEVTTRSMTYDVGIKDWQIAMVSCFAKMDREVGGVCPYGACDDVNSSAFCCSGTIAPENVGTTAVVAVVSASQIVVANCGDSRAVLSNGGKAMPLSQDHKPERVDETQRIEAAGGFVIAWKGYRVGALLAVSRAIGDRYLKRYVISEPDVVCLGRTEQDEFLILASDGLWDVIDNDTACDVVRRSLASARSHERRSTLRGEDLASATAAATLVKLAYGKGSQDNITVVVVDLSCG